MEGTGCTSMKNELLGKSATPLCEIALWNNPFDSGDRQCKPTDIDPALSPWIVTLLGSPPKDDTLSRTHLSKGKVEFY